MTLIRGEGHYRSFSSPTIRSQVFRNAFYSAVFDGKRREFETRTRVPGSNES